jgi:hypothetical protein
MEIDPVHQGAGNPREVPLDFSGLASALLVRIGEVATRARLRCHSAKLP